MIDLHCHVLPGLDDGPASLEQALAMAAASAAAGTATIVATPHLDHVWRVRPELIAQRSGDLTGALRSHGIEVEIVAGAEIAISRLVDLSGQQLDEVRLGSGPYLLLECPLSPTAGDFDHILMRIHEREESIVLAHPERSPLFQQEPERLVRLVREGLLCSITTGSMRGDFGGLVRRFTLELLREGLVHNVASDAHDQLARPPGLADAFSSLQSELPGITGQREWLTSLVPAAILAGEPPPPPTES